MKSLRPRSRRALVVLSACVAASTARAVTPVVVQNQAGFEGLEEATVIYFPDTNTFQNDPTNFPNFVDEGGGWFRTTLRNDYPTLGWWDGDRATTNTDRQRTEVKGIVGLGHQKVGQTFEYSFDFRTNPGFTATSRFCHVFQLKATDGNDAPPLVTVTLRKNGSAVQGQIITTTDAATSIPTQTFTFTPGQWHHFVVRITTSAAGSATGAVMTSVNGGAFFGVTNREVYLAGSTDYRPKWGLYRAIGVSDGVPTGDSWVEHRTVTGTVGSTNVLTWKGGTNSNAWDLSATANFLNSGSASVFNTLDQVNFDDSTTNTTVNLSGAVFPGYVRVNSSQNYTLTGSGSLTGGTLRKDGSGTLTLATTNSYAGLTDVRAGTLYVTGSTGNNSLASVTGGTLKAGSNAALGTNSTIGTQINGGVLDINGFNLTTEPITVQGSGVGGAGAIINTGAQQTSALRDVTLSGDTTLGGSGRWDIRGSGAALKTGGASFNLTKTGSNQISLVGASVDAALGNININQGVLAFQTSTTSMGDPAKAVTINSGATLGFYNTSNVMNKQAVLNGGTIWAESGSGNQNTFAGPITLNAAGGTIDAATNAMLTITGNITGTGSLTKVGAGTATLSGANSYTGSTVVAAGNLVLTNNAQAPVLLGAGAVINAGRLILDYNASGIDLADTVDSILTAGFAQPVKFSSGKLRTTNAADSAKGLGWTDDAIAMRVNIAYTYFGDANLDGQVDVNDLGSLATNWQSASNWSGGDFNYDGFVDVADLGTLATNWQAGVVNPPGSSLNEAMFALGLAMTSVPEPCLTSVLPLVATVHCARRRR